MISLKHILPYFNLVVADYITGEDYHPTCYRCHSRKGRIEVLPTTEEGSKHSCQKPYPTLLYVCGYGVLTKQKEQIDKIITDKNKFLFSQQQNGSISFVKKSQIDSLSEKFHTPLLGLGCAKDPSEAIELGKKEYEDTLRFRKLFRLDKTGDLLAALIYERMKWPVLIIALILVAINFIVRGPLEKKYNENHALLVVMQKEKGRKKDLSEQQKELLQEFSSGIHARFASLADKVAQCVPEHILLHELSIQPLSQPLEEREALRIEPFTLLVRGDSPQTSDISRFVSNLREIEEVNELKIISVEQSRDGRLLNFEIKIKL